MPKITKIKGFTLIELLVVILITSITLTFVLLAFGDFGRSKKIRFAAEQLSSLIQLAKQQAILEPAVIGVTVDDAGYQFYRLNFNDILKWEKITNHRIFRPHKFPPNTKVLLKTHSPYRFKKGPPIIINSTGDITPFVLIFREKDQENIIIKITVQQGIIKTETNS